MNTFESQVGCRPSEWPGVWIKDPLGWFTFSLLAGSALALGRPAARWKTAIGYGAGLCYRVHQTSMPAIRQEMRDSNRTILEGHEFSELVGCLLYSIFFAVFSCGVTKMLASGGPWIVAALAGLHGAMINPLDPLFLVWFSQNDTEDPADEQADGPPPSNRSEPPEVDSDSDQFTGFDPEFEARLRGAFNREKPPNLYPTGYPTSTEQEKASRQTIDELIAAVGIYDSSPAKNFHALVDRFGSTWGKAVGSGSSTPEKRLEALNQAFRREVSLELHPDRTTKLPDSERTIKEAQQKELSRLRDLAKQYYDANWPDDTP